MKIMSKHQTKWNVTIQKKRELSFVKILQPNKTKTKTIGFDTIEINLVLSVFRAYIPGLIDKSDN